MLRTVPPLPWFVVQITAALGGDEYSFLEVWLSEDAWQEKIGGRYGTEENPGVALEGVLFAVDDYALCRSSEGEGGSKWELFPLAGGGNVFGPASAGDNFVARFDGTTGKLIQGSKTHVADSGLLTVTQNQVLGTPPQPFSSSLDATMLFVRGAATSQSGFWVYGLEGGTSPQYAGFDQTGFYFTMPAGYGVSGDQTAIVVLGDPFTSPLPTPTNDDWMLYSTRRFGAPEFFVNDGTTLLLGMTGTTASGDTVKGGLIIGAGAAGFTGTVP